jgi:putative redox protein
MGVNTIDSVYQGGMNFTTAIRGHKVQIDLSEEHGGNDLGSSPKILMLVSLAGCTGVDVVALLNKMRVQFSDLIIHVHAHLTDDDPKIYDEVVVTYKIRVNEKDEPKVEKAVALSQDKYCGVSEMFRAFARLSHEVIFVK